MHRKVVLFKCPMDVARMERRYGLCAAENILGDEKYMVGDDEK